MQGGEGDDTAEPPADAGPFPEHLRRQMNSVKRTGANDTRGLLAALAPLAEFGVSPEEAVHLGFGRFPVGGEARYSHDWWFPRFGPGWRLHMGTDIFAAMGTPVRSPTDGVVRLTQGGLGGISTYVSQPDGTYFYMTHLSGYPPGLVDGQQVKTGQVVGYVGNSGNARTTPPHLHFEIHPGGGSAIDPKPYLDQWIADALAQVPALVAHYRATQPRILVATGLTRRMASGSAGAFSGVGGPPRGQLLWASSMSPGGALRLAQAEALRAADGVDWERWERRELDRALAWEQADALVDTLLAPLTPRALSSFLEGEHEEH